MRHRALEAHQDPVQRRIGRTTASWTTTGARRSPHTHVSPLAWVVALAGPVVVSLALLPLRDEIRTSNVSLVLVLVVVIAAVLGGRVGGAVAALVSLASFDFFFTRPYYSFTINSRDDIETAVLLLVVGLIVGEVVVRTRRSETQRRGRAGPRSCRVRRALGARRRRRAGRAADRHRAGRARLAAARAPAAGSSRSRSARSFPSSPTRGCASRDRRRRTSVTAETGSRSRSTAPAVRSGASSSTCDERATGIALPPEDRALAVALADQLGTVLANEIQRLTQETTWPTSCSSSW